MTTATRRLPPRDWPEPKHPIVYRTFATTTSFGYNPRAPAAPAAPAKKTPAKKTPAKKPSPQPRQVVVAPQNH
jgi:hypothetical protein